MSGEKENRCGNKGRTFCLNPVREACQEAISSRDKCSVDLANLKVRISEIKGKIPTIGTEIVSLAPDDLKKAGELKSEKAAAVDFLARLEAQIPAAKDKLKRADGLLKTRVRIAIGKHKQGAADTISRFLTQAMDYSDEYVEATRALFAELGVDLLPGVMENTPRAKEDRLWAYVENGVLKSPYE